MVFFEGSSSGRYSKLMLPSLLALRHLNAELRLGLDIVDAESWNMALGGLVLGSLILSLKTMRIMMLQLSGFYYKWLQEEEPKP